MKQLDFTAAERAAVLIEALPYMRQFFGKTIVVKYGGNAMVDQSIKQQVMADISLLQYVGIRPVLVHGGGPDITALMAKLQHEPTFVNGLRVTDEATMEIVEMALGRTNKGLVSMLNRHGAKAIGLSGQDADLLVARKHEPDGQDLGYVCEVIQINDTMLQMLADQGYVPVISSVAIGQDGRTYNVNADHAAGAVASALKATKLIVLSDTEGLLENPDEPETLISKVDVSAARELLAAGKASRGMIPKLEACIAAVQSGVDEAHLIDGRLPHSMLIEIFTDSGIGTMVVPDAARRPAMSGHLLGGFDE